MVPHPMFGDRVIFFSLATCPPYRDALRPTALVTSAAKPIGEVAGRLLRRFPEMGTSPGRAHTGDDIKNDTIIPQYLAQGLHVCPVYFPALVEFYTALNTIYAQRLGIALRLISLRARSIETPYASPH